jgi:uncharacterized protein YkwD
MILKWISVLFVIAGILLPPAVTAQASQTWNDERITAEELYAKYGGASEQISMGEAVRYLLSLVNSDRHNRGLQELSWDEAAASAAEEHTGEMTKFHYLSHLDLMGEKPNLRYNRYGGTDHVSENISYRESTLRLFLTRKIVKDIHSRWMTSLPHRKNILAPEHNALGIGITLSWDGAKSVLTAAEEFVDDYGDYSPLPRKVNEQDMLEISGEFANRQTKLLYLMMGREPFPEKQSPKELNANLNGYSLPKPFVALMPKSEAYLHAVKDIPTFYPLNYQPNRGRFSLRFSFGGIYDQLSENGMSARFKPGLYYVMVWVTLPEGKPFIASTQVIRVEG